MKDNSILNKVRELLGMEVKLGTRKLDDGVTTIEAEAVSYTHLTLPTKA